jgi:hypothetical protein
MSDETLTDLQQDERDAMTGNRMAVIRVVSALRQYRAAVGEMLSKRYADGAVDGATLSAFASSVDEFDPQP